MRTKQRDFSDAKEIAEIIAPPVAESTPDNLVHKGRIIFYNSVRKFGYLSDTDEFKDYFFHVSAFTNGIIEGRDPVTFKLALYKGKTVAVEIQKAE